MTVDQEEQVKSREEIMEILGAFDLTKSFRDAGELAGCCITPLPSGLRRDAGTLPGEGPQRRERSSTRHGEGEEWVEPQIQALDRTPRRFPCCPPPLSGSRMDYQRNGTCDLIAALNMATGSMITDIRKSHTSTDFNAFLNKVNPSSPQGPGTRPPRDPRIASPATAPP